MPIRIAKHSLQRSSHQRPRRTGWLMRELRLVRDEVISDIDVFCTAMV